MLSQREEKLLVAARIGRFVGEGLIGDSEWWILWRGGWGRGFGREAFVLVRPVRVRVWSRGPAAFLAFRLASIDRKKRRDL